MKTILFDLDDTLIESMYVWEDAITALFQEMNIDMTFDDAKKTFMSMRIDEVLSYIKKYLAPKQTIEEMNDFIMKYVVRQYKQFVPVKKGALDFMKQCHNEHIQMAVITSNNLDLTEIVLKRLDMYSYLEKVFSAEDLQMTKREPAIYAYALKTMHANVEDTIVFEDSMYAIQTASSLGIRCVGLINDWNHRDFEKNHIQTIHDFTELLK